MNILTKTERHLNKAQRLLKKLDEESDSYEEAVGLIKEISYELAAVTYSLAERQLDLEGLIDEDDEAD